jgi:hypothetical protein
MKRTWLVTVLALTGIALGAGSPTPPAELASARTVLPG